MMMCSVALQSLTINWEDHSSQVTFFQPCHRIECRARTMMMGMEYKKSFRCTCAVPKVGRGIFSSRLVLHFNPGFHLDHRVEKRAIIERPCCRSLRRPMHPKRHMLVAVPTEAARTTSYTVRPCPKACQSSVDKPETVPL